MAVYEHFECKTKTFHNAKKSIELTIPESVGTVYRLISVRNRIKFKLIKANKNCAEIQIINQAEHIDTNKYS